MNSDAEPVEFEKSSGNVFADLNIADAQEELAKADLAIEITRLIRERGVTQMEAAALLGTAQSKISAIRRGQLAHFSYDRLLRFLNLLGCNVQIVVTPAADAMRRGAISANIQAERPAVHNKRHAARRVKAVAIAMD